MPRAIAIPVACAVVIGCAIAAYLVLAGERGDGDSARGPAAKQSAASRALLERGAGPQGSRPVRLNRWRYRSDPGDRGLRAGWAGGRFGGRIVRVPHSPNASAHSGAAGRRAHKGAVGWYAREIRAPVGGDYALEFESAHHRTRVYVDGRLVRTHVGAYEPFSARSQLLAGRHSVAVRVDWRHPQRQADDDWQRGWFNYGGLNRPVTLTRLGPSRLGALTVRTRLTIAGAARVDVTVRVHNAGARRVLRPSGRLVRDGVSRPLVFAPLRVAGHRSATARTSVLVDDPALWSPRHPDRYQLRIDVPGESSLRRMVGLREITWDRDGLHVNGDPLVLRGASLPADARGHGDAMTAADEARLIAELRSIGANATRSQLPLSQSMLDRLDAAGIFVWQEIGPWEPAGRWRATTASAIAAARDRALRTAERDQTHPAILAWTLTNEAARQGFPGQIAYVTRTARRLHDSDPGRPVAADLWGSHLPRAAGPLFAELDAIGVTDYLGWYEQTGSPQRQVAVASRRIARLRALFPGKPLVVTELGAAGSPRSPANEFGGLRFQGRLLARRLRGLLGEPGLSGTLIWALRDYALRPDFTGGSIALKMPGLRLAPGLNEKGLYDFSGRPKPALRAVQEAFDG